jgi:hypothetical protein
MSSNDELSNTVNRLTAGLITAILVALILWIGQTTFHQAAMLAALDEKLSNVTHQLEDVDQRQDGIRKWVDNLLAEVKDSGRSHLTAKDREVLEAQLRQTEQSTTELERKFVERLNGLELRLASLETQHQHSQEVAALESEITQLRSDLTRATAVQEAQSQQPQNNDRFARGVPVFLPPVDNHR